MNALQIVDLLETLHQSYDGNNRVQHAISRLQLAVLADVSAVFRKELPKRVRISKSLNAKEKATATQPNGGKIQAIKLVRDRWLNEGFPKDQPILQMAKAAVETWMLTNLGYTHHPIQQYADDHR